MHACIHSSSHVDRLGLAHICMYAYYSSSYSRYIHKALTVPLLLLFICKALPHGKARYQ
jgi:hypothetical protein